MNSDGKKLSSGEGDTPRFLASKPLKARQAAASQKKQWVILGVLSFFLVYLVFQTFVGGKKKPSPPASKAQVSAAAVSAAEPTEALTSDNDLFQAPGHSDDGRSSPFTRAASEPGTPPVQIASRLVLQGVLSDSSGSAYAVINEKIVKKGERMADKVVTTIQSDSVTLLSDNGEEVTIRMKT